MEIEERVVGDVTILDLKGKMTLGEGDEMLKDKINSLLASGQEEAAAESRGRALHRQRGPGRSRADLHDGEPAGRQPQAGQPDQAHQDLLSITKLLTVFETFDSEAEAVKSYK